MMASSSQEDSSSRTRNYGDGPPWIFTGRWSICFSYCCCCCCCFHLAPIYLLFCDSNWSYSPPPFRNPDVSYISYEILYVENLVEAFLSGFLFFCFFFFLWGCCHSQGFHTSQFNESFAKVFSDAGEVFVVFSFGSNLLLFSDWNWSYSPPPFRHSDVSFISYETLFVENLVEVLLSRFFFGHSQGSHTCQFNESFAKVSSDASEVLLLLLFYLAPIYYCCCCCVAWTLKLFSSAFLQFQCLV